MPETFNIPKNIIIYRNSADTIAVGFQIDPNPDDDIFEQKYEIQFDTANTFNTVNRLIYNQETIFNFQNGAFSRHLLYRI